MTDTGASSSLIDVVLHDQEASGDITFPEIPSSAASADQKEGTGTQKGPARRLGILPQDILSAFT